LEKSLENISIGYSEHGGSFPTGVIAEWIGFYNAERPHSALAGQTPAEAYGARQPVDMMDKAIALPTSSQAQQQQQKLKNRVLAA
jgi:hypothetical protein